MAAPDFGRRVVVGTVGGTPRLKAEDELSREGGTIEDMLIIGEQLWVRVLRAPHLRSSPSRNSLQAQPKSTANLRMMTGNDYKFAPGKAYVVTSALLFEQTKQLTLWQQVGNGSISWGQTVALFEEYKKDLEFGDRAWMLDTQSIKERFRAQADSNELGQQYKGNRKSYGEGYPSVLAHWDNAVTLQGACPTRLPHFQSPPLHDPE